MDALVREEKTSASPLGLTEKVLFALLALLAFSLPWDGYNLLGLGSPFRLLGFVVLFAFATLITLSAKIRGLFLKNLFSWISMNLLLFIAWSGLTILWAPNTEWALARLVSYIGLLGVAFSISVLPLSLVARIWIALLLGVSFSLPLGFVLPHPNPLLVESGRFSSGGKDPNDYANLVVIAFLVAYFGAQAYISQKTRWLISWLSWLSLVAVPLSGSRTALINVVLSLGLGFLNRGFRGLVQVSLVLGVSVGALFSFSETDLVRGFFQRVESLKNFHSEDAWAGRIDIWRATWHVFTLHPLGGVGVANFAWVSPQYSQAAALIASFREDGGGGVAHNSFLSVLAETGSVGFVLFASLQLSLFLWLFRQRRRHPLAKGLLLGLLAYWIAGLTLTWEYVKVPFLLYGSALALRRGKE